MANGYKKMMEKTGRCEERDMNRTNWYDAYKKLDLCGGQIAFLLEDDEDMMEIRSRDGMLIDIGKPTASNRYYVTVVSSDDEAGWQKPLAEIAVADKRDLLQKIQETILTYRTR